MNLLANKYWHPDPEVQVFLERLIEPQDRVLEIGPGGIPFAKSTHFVERKNMGGQYVDRPNTTYLDVNFDRLPFEDKSFDFVYARHVAEDLFFPHLMLREMQRVAKAGYIETPSPIAELTRGVDGGQQPIHRGYIHHRWVVWNEGDHVHFVEKATIVEHLPILNLYDLLVDPFMWNMHFLWEGSFQFHHHQHDIDFRLHIDYDKLLDRAIDSAVASSVGFRRMIHSSTGATEGSAPPAPPPLV